jgi:hypothetical protein
MDAKNYAQNTKVYLMLGYVALFLVNAFYPKDLWRILTVLTVIGISIIAFPLLKAANKYLSIALLLIGAYLLVKSNARFTDWVEAFTMNSGLVSLLLSLPLLSIILYYEDFEAHVLHITQKYINSNFSFYIISMFITTLFGMLLNLASMGMVYHLLKKTIQNHPRELFYKAITRGFCTNLLWSPNFLSVAVVLQYTGMTWHELAPLGLVLAALGNLLGVLMVKFGAKKEPITTIKNQINIKNNNEIKSRRSSLRIIGIIVSLILLIVSLEYLTEKSVLVIVPVIAFALPIGLGIILKKIDVLKGRLKEYLNISLPRMNDEVILFSAIGFFGYALDFSDSTRHVSLIIQKLGFNSSIILIPFLITMITVFGVIGIHPIITISAIAITFDAGTLPLTQLQLAGTLAVGYFSYTLLSPFSGATLLVTSMYQGNPLDVSIKLNLLYVTLFMILTTIVLTVI